MLLFITAVAVVLVVSFLCSIFESVLLSLTRPQIEVLVQEGKPAGRLLASFKENIDVPIAAILILNTAAHTVGAAVAGASYSNVFEAGTLWVFSILFTLAVLLFTEIIPKTLGVTHAVRLSTPVAHGISGLTRLLRPLVLLSERISRSLRGDAEMPVTSVEEIRLLASLGRTEGVVGEPLAGMIVGATHLGHLDARDIMLPRQAVKFLSTSLERDEVLEILRRTGHSRYPLVASRELDELRGTVLAKDLLDWLLRNPDSPIDWDGLCRQPPIVPDTTPLMTLLRDFQDTRRHLAIVVDEYGSIQGIVTLEDVIEEIVGEITDESDLPAADISEAVDGKVLVNATVDLRRLAASLGVPWNPDEEAATIGGLVTEQLERIPAVGDSVEWQGFTVRVEKADRRHVTLVSIRRDSPE